jgi:DNA-binding MarR family transcriptional regulator
MANFEASATTAPPAAEASEMALRLRPVLARLSLVLRREQHARLSLSLAQSTVLGQLLDGRPRRMGELAATESVRLPTMTEIVARMESQGWVRRQMSETDRRAVEVHLTSTGRRLADDVIASRTALVVDRLRRLSDSERASLWTALPALEKLVAEVTP